MFGLRRSFILLFFILSIAGFASGQSADQLYSGGRQAFTDGFWPTAASQFARLLRDFPEDRRVDSAAYMAAVAYYNAQDYDRSIRILESFSRHYPDSAWNGRVAYWEGLGHYAKKNWREAAAAFRSQAELKEEPTYRDRALLYLGACREKLEEWGAAEEAYIILENDSRDYDISARAVFRLGQIRLADERADEALTSFNRLAFDYSGSSLSRDAEYWIAESQRRLGRDESALTSYRNFLSSVYDSKYRSHALLEAARLSAGKGNDEDALAYLDLRESEWNGGQDSDSGIVLRIRAASYLRTGHLDEARSAYTAILKNPADQAEAQTAAFDLAQTWIGTSGVLRAVPYLETASNGPDERIAADSLYTAGQILLVDENYNGADLLSEFSTRFPEEPRREESLRLIVATRKDQGRNAQALSGLNTLILDYPESNSIASYFYMRGELSLAEGDSSTALSDFGRISREYSHSEYASDSYSRIGFIYAGRAEHIRASEYYLKAAELTGGVRGGDKGRQAVYSAAVAKLNGRDSRGAVELFSSLVRSDPSGPWGVEAAYHMGEALYDDGDYKAARDAYALAAEHGDSNWAFEAAYALGWTWFRESSWSEAADAFERAVVAAVSQEQKARSRYRVGLSFASAGDWERAIPDYEQALDYGESPWREEALYQQAWAMLNVNRREDSFVVADILQREFPRSNLPADLPFRMGENAMSSGDYGRAVEWYDICFDRYPASSIATKAQLRAALASREGGDPSEASRRYEIWILDHSDDAGANAAARSWGEALKASGDPALATEAKEKILEIDSDLEGPAVPVILAWVRVSGLPSEASKYLDIIAENENSVATERAEALLLRAHLYRAESNHRKARQIYEVLIRDIPGRTGAESQEGLARSFAEEGKVDEAAEAYLAVPYLYPEETDLAARSLREAERLYRETGRTDEADKIADRIAGN